MFSRSINKDDVILQTLADAYKCYESIAWDYYKADAGVGGFLISGCIGDAQKLKFIGCLIGKKLFNEPDNENAIIASILFDKIYREGFKDGARKDDIRKRFSEILPEDSIKGLDAGIKMKDCMQTLYLYEQEVTEFNSAKSQLNVTSKP